ncbi:selenocysteine insertion sequence-binding protein 2 [Culicoides brevitarsis]|uniref:selenocysteine insertion sequence-binding protein 2 n=1 Tax=Culicoides brevitarsis TaxID=469753 RepID=UPI00307C1A8F
MNNWSNIVKEEKKPFNLREWPEIGSKNADSVIMDSDISIKSEPISVKDELDFPSLKSSKGNFRRKKHHKAQKLCQELSNEKPFEVKYSNKVQKRLTKSSDLHKFMNKKPMKPVKNAEVEKLMQRIKESKIVTFKGRKQEFPKKRITRLKKNILRIRAEKQRNLTDIFSGNTQEVKTEVTESIENLKIDSDIIKKEENFAKNPFSASQEIIQHSRQFRPYCTNLTSDLLCELTETFLVQLRIFQTKQHQKNPEKCKKRYVTGLNEIHKFLTLKKIKLLIIAPDLEPSPGEGGLDEKVQQMKSMCDECHIPYVFSLKRRKIGYLLFKKIPVSCVGVLNYDGCEELYGKLMDELVDQIARYKSAKILP